MNNLLILGLIWAKCPVIPLNKANEDVNLYTSGEKNVLIADTFVTETVKGIQIENYNAKLMEPLITFSCFQYNCLRR